MITYIEFYRNIVVDEYEKTKKSMVLFGKEKTVMNKIKD